MNNLFIELSVIDGEHKYTESILCPAELCDELTDEKFKLLCRNMSSKIAEKLFPDENLN